MAPEENVLEEINVDEMEDLTDEQLEAIAGGAGTAQTKPCSTCGNDMKLKGSSGHLVYYCSVCKELHSAES